MSNNPDKDRRQHLQEMSDFYANNSNLAMGLCNDTTRNLNGLLMTASLAYIGVLASVIDVEMLQKISNTSKTFIIFGVLFFIASIVCGTFESVAAIKLFRKTTPKYMEIANLLAKAIYDDSALDEANSKINKMAKYTDKESGKYLLYGQIGSFLIGTVLTLLYVIGIMS